MPTTEEECLDALREAAEELGESPTKAQYEELGLTPASTTILRIVGGWNEAKAKAGLETFEQGENGGTDVQPKPEWVDLPDDLVWEELTAQQRWYYKNRDHRIERKERRRRELQRWFHEVKRDELECTRCDEGRPPCLDFHHTEEKDRGVSRMVNYGYGRERIWEEIDACVVLCANCHRKEHYEAPDATIPSTDRFDIDPGVDASSKAEARRRRRAWLVAYKRESDGCSRCGTSDPACLDFHHTGEKTLGIAQMVSRGRPLAAIRAELEKCELLCANCHRDRHHEPPDTDGVSSQGS